MADVKIVDHTQEVINETDLAAKRALEQIGMKMERYAKMLCPVGTPESTGISGYMGGTLRNSITYVTSLHDGLTIEVKKGEANPFVAMHGGKKVTAQTGEENVAFVGTNVYYAPYVEYGTQKKNARSFLRPSVADHMNEYKHIFSNELKKVGK